MSSVPIPSKGDIVTIENKQYRVLKVSGTIVEVLAMYDATTSQNFNDTNKTVAFTGGNTGLKYQGSNLDTYLNETFFATLSATMKAAIVPKTINQDMWNYSGSVPSSETYYHLTYGSSNLYYFDTLNGTAYGTVEVGSRNVYALSVKDVIDYLGVSAGGDFADTDIWQIFWNRSTSIIENIWLRSAYRNISSTAFYVFGKNGYFIDNYYNNIYHARPAFQIDWNILYPSAPALTFKHFFDAGTIGSGTVKFRHYSQQAQLATPQNVTASGTIVSWGAVENATSYEILVSGSSFGTVSTTSVDLSTLSGWASLTDGTYNITIVAKADGYRDSEASAAVSVTKSAAFRQIFPTKASDGNTLLENLNQSKIYTIKTDEPFSYLMYDSGTWKINNDDSTAGSIEIISQTANSVKIGVNIYRAYLNGYISGITLEGDVKATPYDFAGLSSTEVYAYYACFVEGTKITLSDGSTKLVQDIQYGDKVLCYDFTNGTQTTSYIDWMMPERIATKYWEIMLSDGTILNLVGSNGKSHRLYNITKQRFDYPQDFEADDLTLKEDGTTARVVSCKQIEKTVKFYNIASHEHINVYANGVLTSNRLNNRFKIVGNKFTDEKVMTDKEVEDYCDYLERIKAK